MDIKEKFKKLKKVQVSDLFVTLAILREYKKDRTSKYIPKYIKINQKLEKKLKSIVVRIISEANAYDEYTFDCPEPEADKVRFINYAETDFIKIFDKLKDMNPETDTIENIEDLYKSKAYLIILRDKSGIQIIGYKNLPESWKMKKDKGLIPLLFKDNRFEDLETENVFSISTYLDFIYYKDVLFILSKKEFEKGLNFREGMIAKADELYLDFDNMNLIENLEILKEKVGNNQRFLRKVATVKNLGYYKDNIFMKKLAEVNTKRNFNLTFNNGAIVVTEDNFEDILTLLSDKRLLSELTAHIYDVESAKIFN